MQGIVGPSEAHREARWLDDDESQVSTKLEICSIPARWIRFLVISSNFVTRSFSCELLKFSKDLFNVRPVNLRQFFFSMMELALLQMAPPLITESVFLPSKLVLLSQPLLTFSLLFFSLLYSYFISPHNFTS